MCECLAAPALCVGKSGDIPHSQPFYKFLHILLCTPSVQPRKYVHMYNNIESIFRKENNFERFSLVSFRGLSMVSGFFINKF